MRWSEIINEAASVTVIARSFILDILAPLKTQGVDSITVQQILDQMANNPDFEGVTLEPDFVMAALRGVKDLRIERDANNGVMTVFIDGGVSNRQVDAKQAEKEKENIRKAALRTIDREDDI